MPLSTSIHLDLQSNIELLYSALQLRHLVESFVVIDKPHISGSDLFNTVLPDERANAAGRVLIRFILASGGRLRTRLESHVHPVPPYTASVWYAARRNYFPE